MSLSDPDFLLSDVEIDAPASSSSRKRPSLLSNLRSHAAADLAELGSRAKILAFPANSTAPAVTSHDPEDGTAPTSSYRGMFKRLCDLVLITVSAPIWAPVIVLAALMIFLRDGHNPFYVQDRIGKDGKSFRMFKLRSMVPNAEAKLEAHLASDPAARLEWDTTQKLKRDPRITTLGRIIRKSSIDELPQLINVLIGTMSIVGPRPFMVNQKDMYHGRRYYDLRPGLTGFWQISDRNECNFAQRAHFDTAYFRSMSLKTDLIVMLRTVAVMARGTGH